MKSSTAPGSSRSSQVRRPSSRPDARTEPPAGRQNEKEKESSGSRLRDSRQSRCFQVALQLPHRAPVQGAQVEVKGRVGDVEVSRLLDQVHDLENTGRGGSQCDQCEAGGPPRVGVDSSPWKRLPSLVEQLSSPVAVCDLLVVSSVVCAAPPARPDTPESEQMSLPH